MDLAILQSLHPEVKAMRPAWERIRVLMEEDEVKYTDPKYFFDFPNEDQAEKERRRIAYSMGFFNPTQDLISASGEYILRQQITRTSSSSEIQKFYARADKSGQSLNDFVKNQISPNITAYGTVFAVVDKPRNIFATKAQELAGGMPYLCILHPLQVMDWAYGEDGKLLWFRYIQAEQVDKSNAFAAPSGGDIEYITWTQSEWVRHNKEGKEVDRFAHNFGLVPVAIQASFLSDSEKTLGKSTFFSGSRHIFMGNSHLSKANQEILKYGSTLLISSMDFDPRQRERDIDPASNLRKLQSPMAEGNVLSTNDMANPPAYLEKDISVVEVANAQAQKYFDWAAHAEATGQTAMPLAGPEGSPQSGVAKAYDFQDVDANLHAKALDLQAIETEIVSIVAAELKVNAEYSIKYPTSFDVDSFEAKVSQVADLDRIGFASELGKKIAQKRITPDLTQDEAERKAIDAEIDAAKSPEPVTPDKTFP